ncbi:MAG: PQQ-binding-like beta-propeller repeat protein, partial [Vicinamibacterales bacterium]
MTRVRAGVVVVVVAAVAVVGGARAQDWNQWRGPSRAGVTTTFAAPAKWPDRPTQAWEVKVGGGHSSPIVSNGRVFLHSRVEEQEVVTAFDLLSGKQVWQQRYDAPYEMHPAARAHGQGPKSTPVAAAGRLFTFGISGTLSAFDAASGKRLWQKRYSKEFDAASPDFGTAMSPVVEGDMLIAHVGGIETGGLAALDAATGQSKWMWKGDSPAYASPVVATFGKTRQVITQSRSHVVGINAADGRLLWSIPLTTEYHQNIVTPVIAGDLVIYSGIRKPLAAV